MTRAKNNYNLILQSISGQTKVKVQLNYKVPFDSMTIYLAANVKIGLQV